VQLFAKTTIGKPVGWQANVSLSAGYAIPGGDKIENSGNTLTTRPNFKGGFTAGFRLGLAYFFTSHFGVGLSFTGQYFENKNNDEALMSYKPMALPVMGGVRVRF
jgi:opacity protein-like surface antigen